MATDKRNQTLSTYASDVHALLAHGVQTIHRQVDQLKNVSHRDAKTAVVAFESMLRKQEMELNDRIKALGGSTTKPVKDVVAAVTGAAAGLMNAVRSSETTKSIRDDYTYLSHLAIAWLMLHTAATSLGDRETAGVAERGYADTTRMIMHIDRIMPRIIVEELKEDKSLQPLDIEDQTRSMVKKAWEQQAPLGV